MRETAIKNDLQDNRRRNQRIRSRMKKYRELTYSCKKASDLFCREVCYCGVQYAAKPESAITTDQDASTDTEPTIVLQQHSIPPHSHFSRFAASTALGHHCTDRFKAFPFSHVCFVWLLCSLASPHFTLRDPTRLASKSDKRRPKPPFSSSLSYHVKLSLSMPA